MASTVLGPQRLGTTRAYTIALADAAGSAVDLSGASSLSGAIFPRGGGPAVATFSDAAGDGLAVLSAGDGTVTLTVDDAKVPAGAVSPARYVLEFQATIGGEPYEGLQSCYIDFEDTAAAVAANGTRAQVESIMVRRVGRILEFWHLDGQVKDGHNADVGAALGRALLEVGGTLPTNLASPSDADVDGVDAADLARVLDLTHLHLIEACLDNADEVRGRRGVNEQEWNGRIAELRRRYDQKLAEVGARYGDGVGSAGVGTIALDFLQPDPDEVGG